MPENWTNNVGLQAMRNAWREGLEHFDDDRVEACPVYEAIAEAEARLVRPNGCYHSPEGFSGRQVDDEEMMFP